MFRLDKRKIFLLYRYYLLGKIEKTGDENDKEKERIVWLDKCWEKEQFLKEKIEKYLSNIKDFQSKKIIIKKVNKLIKKIIKVIIKIIKKIISRKRINLFNKR